MDFSGVERYLDTFVNHEVLPGFGFAESGYDLSHLRELLRRLGNPHIGPRTVHVTGSKGKGSVSAMVASAVAACGFTTGLYTSPHLVHLGERIQVNGACASSGELMDAMDVVRPHLQEMQGEARWRGFTYFEVLTVAAFLHFRAKKVQVQVLEVGLGGRLDATNVVNPDVCVITPISLEHTAVLGGTLAKIAGEKAGIIKPGAHVVSAPQPDEAMRVIDGVCSSLRTPLAVVGRGTTWDVLERSEYGQSLRVRSADAETVVSVPLAGSYQAENAAVAMATLDALKARGVSLRDDCVARGLGATRWPGRFQTLAHEPMLLLDGAHNPASMRRLAESIAGLGRCGDIVFVLGFSSDKDVRGAVSELSCLGGRYVLTHSGHPRALAPADMAARLNALGLELRCVEDPCEALWCARRMARRDGMVVVTGSLYMVGEVLRLWLADAESYRHWVSDPAR